jgi:toxin ParE1/3/4
MTVTIAEAAETDLERIGDSIARDLPRRAVSFIAELRESCESLGSMPEAFPLVPGHHKSGIRRRVHGNYLIFYKVARDRIVVIRILHGAMDYEARLF